MSIDLIRFSLSRKGPECFLSTIWPSQLPKVDKLIITVCLLIKLDLACLEKVLEGSLLHSQFLEAEKLC